MLYVLFMTDRTVHINIETMKLVVLLIYTCKLCLCIAESGENSTYTNYRPAIYTGDDLDDVAQEELFLAIEEDDEEISPEEVEEKSDFLKENHVRVAREISLDNSLTGNDIKEDKKQIRLPLDSGEKNVKLVIFSGSKDGRKEIINKTEHNMDLIIEDADSIWCILHEDDFAGDSEGPSVAKALGNVTSKNGNGKNPMKFLDLLYGVLERRKRVKREKMVVGHISDEDRVKLKDEIRKTMRQVDFYRGGKKAPPSLERELDNLRWTLDQVLEDADSK